MLEHVIDLFGTAAATAMMLCYALDERGPGFTLGFAGITRGSLGGAIWAAD